MARATDVDGTFLTRVDISDRAGRVLGDVAVVIPEPLSVDDNGDSLTVDSPQLPAALVGGRFDTNIGSSVPIDVTILEPLSIDDNGASLTTDTPQLPAALVGGRLDVNVGNALPTQPALLAVVIAGGANAIATLTFPAAGAGLFHYLTHLFLKRVATAALAGGAILTVTSTNLPGNPSWRTGNQMSITVATQEGAILLDQAYAFPLRSAVANTATTIVMPAAGAAVSWHAVAQYYTGT